MEKEVALRKIGNSQGIILPKPLVNKYSLDRVTIEDTGDGLFIRPVDKMSFQHKLTSLKSAKVQSEKEMREAASLADVQTYYEHIADSDSIDLDIFD